MPKQATSTPIDTMAIFVPWWVRGNPKDLWFVKWAAGLAADRGLKVVGPFRLLPFQKMPPFGPSVERVTVKPWFLAHLLGVDGPRTDSE